MEYQPLLEAILFCLIDCDLTPRIATERLDSGEVRLTKIAELIRRSSLSIHDLSRVHAAQGRLARLNMPFELGIAYGFLLASERQDSRALLVIAKDKYLYQQALSDIAGWDIRPHGDHPEEAVRHIRTWLHSHGLGDRSTSQILGDYTGYQEWDYERLLDEGWTEKDIQERETLERLEAMKQWRDTGRAPSFD